MASYKVCFVLLTLCLAASANVHYDRFHSFSHEDPHVHHDPWLHGYEPYRTSSSEHLPIYHPTSGHSGESGAPSTSRFVEHSGESFLGSGTKKVPKEDKSFKKPLSSYYTITEKDSQMYKDMVLKTGLPYCEEIKRAPETVTKRSAKDSITCYKCKNPKNGATYEQCSYSSDPPKESSPTKAADFVASPSSYRYRRSSSERDGSSEAGSRGYRDRTDYRSSPYRFTEELLADNSQELPAGYKKEGEKCQKVLKNSMVCMVCEDTKGNGKYEQCTYVRKPSDKSYAYSRSSSFGKPEEGGKEGSESKDHRASDAPERREYKYPGSKYEEVERKEDKDHGASGSPSRSYDYHSNEHEEDGRKKDGEKVENEDYPTSRSETHSGYSYPGEEYKGEASGDRADGYASSKPVKEDSREYKYPKESYESSKGHEDRDYSASHPENIEVHSDYKYPSKKYEESGDRSRSENLDRSSTSDKHSIEDASRKDSKSKDAESEESDNCKRVQRDSKTCTVCKDPKTGGNYEKCSYAYQPNDKLYQFSRSKSFGYPHSSEASENPKYEKSSGESAEATDYKSDYTIPDPPLSYYKPGDAPPSSYVDGGSQVGYTGASSRESKSYADEEPGKYSKSESEKASTKISPGNCEKVQRDSMTCTICKDPKTGGDFEQCSYSYQPTDKLFSYSKSSSFGSPTETDGSTSYKSAESRDSPSKDTRKYSEIERDEEASSGSAKKEFQESPEREEGKEDKKEEVQEGGKSGKKVDGDFFDSMRKKAEIERFLQEFQKEDRSNCKKVMRDNMTCYQCVDDKGFQKEECAFITANAPDKDRLSYREVKEFQVDPTKKVPRSVAPARGSWPREPVALDLVGSASERFHVKREKPKQKKEEKEEEADGKTETKEAEPYDYSSETRTVFDKTLGLSLPAYMLAKSEGELEFDEIVASSKY